MGNTSQNTAPLGFPGYSIICKYSTLFVNAEWNKVFEYRENFSYRQKLQ